MGKSMKEGVERPAAGSPWYLIFEALGLEQYDELRLLPENSPRVLVICRGGNSRSVGLAFLLKYKYSVDALSASLEKNSTETLRLLCEWADKVVLVEGWMYEPLTNWLPYVSRNKFLIFDVGGDWGADGMIVERLVEFDSRIQEVLSKLPKAHIELEPWSRRFKIIED